MLFRSQAFALDTRRSVAEKPAHIFARPVAVASLKPQSRALGAILGGIRREGFDESRPRLEAFDREHPEPTAEELARPLESLTPPGWEARLEAIVERGLVTRGALPASSAPWRLTEAAGAAASPAGAREPGSAVAALREELADARVPLGDGTDLIEVAVHSARTPLSGAPLESLRARCRERPTVLIGLQNDSFLDQLPEAAFTLSAADCTPLTRRVVARTLARRLREAGAARS